MSKALNELKKATMASYLSKAGGRVRSATKISGDFEADHYKAMATVNKHHPNVVMPGFEKDPEKLKKAETQMKVTGDLRDTFKRDAYNRIKGIARAGRLLAKEEAKQIDELKLNTAVNTLRQMKRIAGDWESSPEDSRRAVRFRNAIKRKWGAKGAEIADKASGEDELRNKQYNAGDPLGHGLHRKTLGKDDILQRGPRKGKLRPEVQDVQKSNASVKLTKIKQQKKPNLPEETINERNTESHPNLWNTHELRHESGKALKKGDKVKGFRGTYKIQGFEMPHHSGSTGRVYTDKGSFFPGVVNAKIVAKEEVEQVNEAPLTPEHKAALKALRKIPSHYTYRDLDALAKHTDNIAKNAEHESSSARYEKNARVQKKNKNRSIEISSRGDNTITYKNKEGHKLHLRRDGHSYAYNAHLGNKSGPIIDYGSESALRYKHKIGGYNKHFKKAVKEEAEQIDELKRSTVASYLSKAINRHTTNMAQGAALAGAASVVAPGETLSKDELEDHLGKKAVRQMDTRPKGMNRALNRLAKEEAEQIDELKLNTAVRALRSMKSTADDFYASQEDQRRVTRFRNAIKRKWGERGAEVADKVSSDSHTRQKAYDSGDMLKNKAIGKDDVITRGARKGKLRPEVQGSRKATTNLNLIKLKKQPKPNLPEEVEQIDEISRSTIAKVATARFNQAQAALKQKDYGGYVKKMKKAIKAADATTPNTGWSPEDDNTKKNEEVQISAQEKYRQIKEAKIRARKGK